MKSTQKHSSGGNIGVRTVPTSTYRTINFQNEPNSILYSGGITACVAVLIKNYNQETEKYDNIVTVAHFWPNNAFDEKIASDNLKKTLKEFQEQGGQLNENTSIQLIGGCNGYRDADNKWVERPYEQGPKAILADAIKEVKELENSTVKIHGASYNKGGENIYLFVNIDGTAILKSLPLNNAPQITALVPITNLPSSMPGEYLTQIIKESAQNNLNGTWSKKMLETSREKDQMPLLSNQVFCTWCDIQQRQIK